jgi:heptosyltransferase-1/heptosyltransferase-2
MREGSGLVSKAICGEHSHDHVIERYLDVARYLGADIREIEFPLPDLTKEEQSVSEKLVEKGFSSEQKYVVFVPGARWETKEWPPKHYAALADKIADDGTFVVLAGGPDEREKAALIEAAAETDKIIDLTGQTSLRELAALIKGCEVFISGDTGPLHFAAALKRNH